MKITHGHIFLSVYELNKLLHNRALGKIAVNILIKYPNMIKEYCHYTPPQLHWKVMLSPTVTARSFKYTFRGGPRSVVQFASYMCFLLYVRSMSFLPTSLCGDF